MQVVPASCFVLIIIRIFPRNVFLPVFEKYSILQFAQRSLARSCMLMYDIGTFAFTTSKNLTLQTLLLNMPFFFFFQSIL